MKIAYINTSKIPSMTANSNQVMKVCQALTQVNGPVCLWVPGNHPTGWPELAERYGLVTSFELHWLPLNPAFHNYDFAWKSVDQAKSWGADLVYTRGLQVAVIALLRGIPVILEQHLRITGFTAPWLFRIFLRWPGKKRLLVITQSLKQILEQEFGSILTLQQIQVAPSGVDLERYEDLPDSSAARKLLGFPDRPTAVYTGNFYPGRGMELLFNLCQRFPAANFLWIGGKPEEVASWQSRLDKAGIQNVILTGFIDNKRLPLYQAAADVLLMPYERFIGVSGGGNTGDICSPIKMFEYLASGRPIISSDLPVLREVLTPENAILCSPDDLQAWGEALTRLFNEPLLGLRLTQQAHIDIQQYTWRVREERALTGFY
jgi:glycosyltransferase involved in cell wall biosynthesis